MFINEVDTLELRLKELNDVVSYTIIFEADVDHHGQHSRPFARQVLELPRFAFARRVTVVTLTVGKLGAGDVFRYERAKERLAQDYLRKVLQPTDVVIFGHADEIPRREAAWKVKHCDVPLPANFALWFPMDRTFAEFKSDFPAKGLPWTLGDPAVYMVRDMDGISLGKYDNVAGPGFHASNYCYLPNVYLKMRQGTEFNLDGVNGDVCKVLREFCVPGNYPGPRFRPARADTFKLNAPWALQRARFPVWFGLPDSRLASNG